MDPVLVDGEPLADVLKDTNDIPTVSSLESNGAEGESARGDPPSMSSRATVLWGSFPPYVYYEEIK